MPFDKKKYMKEYNENHKQHMKEQKKEWYQTEAGIKSNRISKWKRYEGMSLDYDWDEIYTTYISTDFCNFCDVELVEGNNGSNRKCLDHNHITGEIRGVICTKCNTRDVLA